MLHQNIIKALNYSRDTKFNSDRGALANLPKLFSYIMSTKKNVNKRISCWSTGPQADVSFFFKEAVQLPWKLSSCKVRQISLILIPQLQLTDTQLFGLLKL